MAERTIEALLLSRDPGLADALDEALEPIGVQVVRNAPRVRDGSPRGEGKIPPQAPRADDGPPLLIVDGRDYLNVCRFTEADDASGGRAASPTLLLLNPKDIEALSVPLKADEVVCLPLRPEEVRLRIRSLLGPPLFGRIRQPPDGRPSPGGKARRAPSGLQLDDERYEITLDGEPLNLTFREYELLKYLMGRPGRTFTREHLLAQVWGDDYLGGTRTVDVHIRRLRMKVEEGGREFIKTVRSVGYKFVG